MRSGTGLSELTDELPMIEAPGCMCGSAALVRWKNADRFVASVKSHSSSGISSMRLVRHLERGVADQHVDPAELLDGPGDDRAAVRGLADVAGDEDGLAAGLLDPGRRLLGVVVLVEVADQDVGTFAGVGDGDGPADAAVGAGDHGLLALEPSVADVALLAVVGLRVHRGGGAGGLLLLGGLRHDRPVPGAQKGKRRGSGHPLPSRQLAAGGRTAGS